MKKNATLLSIIFLNSFMFGQSSSKYDAIIKKADNYYRVKNYKASGLTYTQAFKFNKWKVPASDRYNAACVWALADVPDSAFYQLNYIAANNFYSKFEQINAEHDLKSLQKDKRWKPLMALIKQNQEKKEAKLNKPLIKELDTIYINDQQYRSRINETKENYGVDSKEMQKLWKTIHENDSINTEKVKTILDNYGWLGKDIIGEEGNSTLFLVIQHSHIDDQEKYLPIMRMR